MSYKRIYIFYYYHTEKFSLHQIRNHYYLNEDQIGKLDQYISRSLIDFIFWDCLGHDVDMFRELQFWIENKKF